MSESMTEEEGWDLVELALSSLRGYTPRTPTIDDAISLLERAQKEGDPFRMPIEKVNADLRRAGIDPTPAIKRVLAAVKRVGARKEELPGHPTLNGTGTSVNAAESRAEAAERERDDWKARFTQWDSAKCSVDDHIFLKPQLEAAEFRASVLAKEIEGLRSHLQRAEGALERIVAHEKRDHPGPAETKIETIARAALSGDGKIGGTLGLDGDTRRECPTCKQDVPWGDWKDKMPDGNIMPLVNELAAIGEKAVAETDHGEGFESRAYCDSCNEEVPVRAPFSHECPKQEREGRA